MNDENITFFSSLVLLCISAPLLAPRRFLFLLRVPSTHLKNSCSSTSAAPSSLFDAKDTTAFTAYSSSSSHTKVWSAPLKRKQKANQRHRFFFSVLLFAGSGKEEVGFASSIRECARGHSDFCREQARGGQNRRAGYLCCTPHRKEIDCILVTICWRTQSNGTDLRFHLQ